MTPLRRHWVVGAVAMILLACSDSTAPPPPATQLTFTVQPSNATGGAAISPAVAVAIEDSAGDVVKSATDVVTLALGADPGGGALAGTTAVHAVNGVATFAALSINKLGTGYSLTAAAAGLAGATSAAFDIGVGPAARLVFTAQPSNANAGATIAPAVQVAVQDAGGNAETAFTGNVTIAIGTNPGGGTLSGTTTVQAVAGVATFSGLSIAQAGSGYTLKATSSTLTSAASTPFTIALVPTALHITTTTTGAAVPTGYSLCVDPYSYSSFSSYGSGCFWSGAIGVNGAVTVPVAAGSHAVQLNNGASNCSVGGDNPRTITASGTTEVPFSVACLDTGSVHVAITTTGMDVDANGYLVCVDHSVSSCFWSARVHANDVIVISGVTAEPHTISVGEVAGNCTVSGGTSKAVTVLARSTTDVSFNVGCVLAERIAFSSGGTVFITRVDGVGLAVSVAYGVSPAWSADGARLAYECFQDICAISPDGSSFAQLTADAASNHHPSWSPDGSKIAFSSARSGMPELWAMGADGSGAVQLTQNVGFVGSPAWSPDGTKLAFDCQVDAGNDDICVVNADGTGFARLTNDPARDYGAAWKRDGSALAFATTRNGAAEIVLMSPTGGSVTRIGAGLAGSEPTWSPDGSQLGFVRADQSGRPTIMAAHTDGSNVVFISFGDQPAWKPHP